MAKCDAWQRGQKFCKINKTTPSREKKKELLGFGRKKKRTSGTSAKKEKPCVVLA